jgi:hypothetical protein
MAAPSPPRVTIVRGDEPEFPLYMGCPDDIAPRPTAACDQARSRGGGRERVHGDGMTTADRAETVDTMPDATIAAFLDHGLVRRTLDADLDGARATLAALRGAGVSLDAVTTQLQTDDVTQFATAFDALNKTITVKREALLVQAGWL